MGIIIDPLLSVPHQKLGSALGQQKMSTQALERGDMAAQAFVSAI